jgi:hypothetical protein
MQALKPSDQLRPTWLYSLQADSCRLADPTPYVPVACSFVPRHNSGSDAEIQEMVKTTGYPSLEALIDATVPAAIRRKDGMEMGRYTAGMTESEFLDYFKLVTLILASMQWLTTPFLPLQWTTLCWC